MKVIFMVIIRRVGVRWFPIFYNRKKIPSVVHFAWIVTVVTDNDDKIGLS